MIYGGRCDSYEALRNEVCKDKMLTLVFPKGVLRRTEEYSRTSFFFFIKGENE